MLMDEDESTEKLLHNCDDQEQTLSFIHRCCPVNQTRYAGLCAIYIFLEVNVAQLHIDEIKGGVREAPVLEYCNDIGVRTAAKLIHGPYFVRNIFLC